VAKIDENGFETMENAEQPATADIPQDLLNQALQKLNENT
jgi:hypothetical protein